MQRVLPLRCRWSLIAVIALSANSGSRENTATFLHNHISRLRKILPDSFDVISDGHGYKLVAEGPDIESPDIEALDLDVVAFDAAFDEACAASVTERLPSIDEALAVWRGRPFPDLEDDPGAVAAISRLQERHAALERMRAESLLALGRVHEATGELERSRMMRR